MSIWGTLAKIGGYVAAPFTGGASIPVGNALGMGADALSGIGKANAQNQGNQISAAQNQANIATSQDAQNVADRNSAWKNMLQADYVLNNNKGYQPATMHSSVPGMADHQLPTFGIARQPFGNSAGNDMTAGARLMQNEGLQRLQNGPSLQTPNLTGMAQPSAWQKILNVAAPAAKIGSTFNWKQPQQPRMQASAGEDDLSGDL